MVLFRPWHMVARDLMSHFTIKAFSSLISGAKPLKRVSGQSRQSLSSIWSCRGRLLCGAWGRWDCASSYFTVLARSASATCGIICNGDTWLPDTIRCVRIQGLSLQGPRCKCKPGVLHIEDQEAMRCLQVGPLFISSFSLILLPLQMKAGTKLSIVLSYLFTQLLVFDTASATQS